MVMKNNSFNRKQRRYRLKENINFDIYFDYMGNNLRGTLEDISNDGIGFIIDSERNSIIDYEILNIIIDANSKERINVPCRVLYSKKIDSSGRKRKYGAHFLSSNFLEIEDIIREKCSKKDRMER
jgi:c-di-GMP-binding flagellar brake protein YcgR